MLNTKTIHIFVIVMLLMLISVGIIYAQDTETLVLADFEDGELVLVKDSYGAEVGFVLWGDRPGNAAIDIVSATDELALPEQDGDNNIMQITYDIGSYGGFNYAFTDGEEWVSQDWSSFNALEFWLYGANTEARIQVDIFDNRAPDSISDSAERWAYWITDDFDGWQFFSIPFNDFKRRTDWQPSGAPSDGLGLTEVHGISFGFPAGVGEHTNYIDDLMVSNNEDSSDSDETSSEATLIELPEYDPDGEWTLVWSDDFDADAGEPINDAYWTCELGGWGWGNAELQHYTDRTDNVAHDGEGNFVITAREESYRGNNYTSGRCITMDKVEFTYGRIEARINLPEGQGIWPAFWMLGADFPEIGWPDSGEIDIMEYVGKEPRSTHGTVHGPEYNGAGGLGLRYVFDEPVADDFHVFGIEWEPEIIRWTVDGEVFHELTPEWLWGGTWVFDHDFFLLINVAVGGNLPGNPDDTTVFPQEMLVDWVRVYQRTQD